MPPDITVLMPVYNGEKYIREAIESILRQTFTDFEFLIIDDGSSDSTPSLLKEYIEKDKRIRVISNKTNLGIVKTLNLGIQAAKGKYIARMDADDISFPERLEKQYQLLEKNPDIAVVGSNIMLLSENRCYPKKKSYYLHSELIKWQLIFECPLAHPAVFFRKSIFQTLEAYNQDYKDAEDYELWTRLSQFYKIANLPDVLLYYREHQDSVSFKKRERQEYLHLQIMQSYISTFSSNLIDVEILKMLCFHHSYYDSEQCYKVLLTLYQDFTKKYSLDPLSSKLVQLDIYERIVGIIRRDLNRFRALKILILVIREHPLVFLKLLLSKIKYHINLLANRRAGTKVFNL